MIGRKIISYIIGAIAFVATLLFLLSIAAPYIHPAVAPIIALLGMALPFTWAFMAITLILSLIFKTHATTIVLTLSLVLSFPLWRKTIVFNYPPKPDSEQSTLTLLSYNICQFGLDKHHNEIFDYIEKVNADIVCLQEFGFYAKGKMNEKEILSRLDKLYPYRHVWYKNQNKSNSNGVITLSRYPIIKKRKIEIESPHNVSIYSDIVIDSDTIRIVNNHLESNHLDRSDREIAGLITQDDIDKNKLLTTTNSIHGKLTKAMAERANQAKIIREVIDEKQYPTIVMGDFNDVPQSYAYQTIAKDMIDCYASAGKWFYYYTYNANRLYFPIDHIIVSQHFTPTTAQIGKIDSSDHYPVTATVQIKDNR